MRVVQADPLETDRPQVEPLHLGHWDPLKGDSAVLDVEGQAFSQELGLLAGLTHQLNLA